MHEISTSSAGLQPASCQTPASAGGGLKLGADKVPAGAGSGAARHLFGRPSAGILSDPSFSCGWTEVGGRQSAGWSRHWPRVSPLLPAFSRHPVRPQLQLGVDEAAQNASPLQRGFSKRLQAHIAHCLKALREASLKRAERSGAPPNPQLKLGADRVPAEAGNGAARHCLSWAHPVVIPLLVSCPRISRGRGPTRRAALRSVSRARRARR